MFAQFTPDQEVMRRIINMKKNECNQYKYPLTHSSVFSEGSVVYCPLTTDNKHQNRQNVFLDVGQSLRKKTPLKMAKKIIIHRKRCDRI